MTLKPEDRALIERVTGNPWSDEFQTVTVTTEEFSALLEAARSEGSVSSRELAGEENSSSRGCGSDHSGSRDEAAVGATAALAGALTVLDQLSDALFELNERAEGWSVSGVYFNEPIFTENVEAIRKADEAEQARAEFYRTYQPRSLLVAAPPAALPDEAARLSAALKWFGENQNLSLEFDWSDADTDGLDWCVYRESGNRSDREWTVVGSGPTPQAAILAAYKPFADRLPTEEGSSHDA